MPTRSEYEALARKYAVKHGIDPRVFVRQIKQESGFNPHAGSPAGAQGIAQIMPGTARAWGVDPWDANQALDAAAKNMATYKRKYGSYRVALAAYNAGEGAVQKYNGVPPFSETQNYVHKILDGLKPQTPKTLQAPAASDGAPQSAQQPVVQQPTAPPPPPISTPAPPQALDGRQYLAMPQQAPSAEMPSAAPQAAEPAQTLQVMENTAPTGAVRVRVARPTSQRLGKVTFAPGADRAGVATSKKVMQFAGKVAGIYGQPLRVGTGTNHTQRTATGGISDHWNGNAVDVPLTGRNLIRAGQAALIAAGMPESKARKIKGGLFNINGHQIIFNDVQQLSGSPHDDHLHLSAK